MAQQIRGCVRKCEREVSMDRCRVVRDRRHSATIIKSQWAKWDNASGKITNKLDNLYNYKKQTNFVSRHVLQLAKQNINSGQ